MFELHQEVVTIVDNVVVKYFITDFSQPVIVSFACAASSLSHSEIAAGHSPWSYDFWKKNGINVVAFASIDEENWYQSEALSDFCDQLRGWLAPFPKRLGYGYSMGGFGVAAYGNQLGLDHAMLFAPATSTDPRIVEWDTKARSRTAERGLDWLGPMNDSIHCRVPLTILYDPLYELDRRHVRRYEHQLQLDLMPMPGIGHSVPESLLKLNMLKSVCLEFAAGRIDRAAFFSKLRKRRTLYIYFQQMKNAARRRNSKKAQRVIHYHRLRWSLKNLNKIRQHKAEAKDRRKLLAS